MVGEVRGSTWRAWSPGTGLMAPVSSYIPVPGLTRLHLPWYLPTLYTMEVPCASTSANTSTVHTQPPPFPCCPPFQTYAPPHSTLKEPGKGANY